MAMQDLLESLQNFDLDQLNDVNNVGSWPVAVKIIIWVLCFAGALAVGYFMHVTNLQGELSGLQFHAEVVVPRGVHVLVMHGP